MVTDKERYQRAFQTLHASDKIYWEADKMTARKNKIMKKVVAAGAAFVLVSGSITAAYAADIGGIQQKLTMWLHGEQTEVTARDYGENSYKYTYTDEDGKKQEFVAGGVTIDDSGNEHPVSAQEILDDFTDHISIGDDGRTYLNYWDTQQQIDITDLFDQKGECRVAVKDGDRTAYFTVFGYGEDGYEKTFEEPEDAAEYTFVK